MESQQERREAAIKHLKEKRAFGQDVVAYVVVNAFLVFVWSITGAGYFWPAWVMGAWGIGIVMHAYTVFFQRPITEDEIQREMHKRGGAAA